MLLSDMYNTSLGVLLRDELHDCITSELLRVSFRLQLGHAVV